MAQLEKYLYLSSKSFQLSIIYACNEKRIGIYDLTSSCISIFVFSSLFFFLLAISCKSTTKALIGKCDAELATWYAHKL